MSDSNSATLRMGNETVYGQNPDPAAAMQEIRFTNETLKGAPGFTTSKEIRADRNIPDIIRNDLKAIGNIDGELSYGTYDNFFRDLLMYGSASWSTPVANGPKATIAAVAATQRFTDTGSGFGSFEVYQFCYVTGFSSAANNGIFKISAVDGSAGYIEVELGEAALVDEALGQTVTITMMGDITNGTTLRSWYAEREYTDLTTTFALFNGLCLNTANISGVADDIIKVSFGWLGKVESSGTATVADSSAAPNTNKVMNNIDDVYRVIIDGVDVDVHSWSIAVDNKLRERKVCGTEGVVSIGKGQFAVTGNLEMYFESNTQYNKLLNKTEVDLIIILYRDSNYYVIQLPCVLFTDGSRNAGGLDTDIMVPLEFSAKMDATEGITMRIARMAA